VTGEVTSARLSAILSAAGQPVIYVIRSTPRLSRRGQQGHARFAAQAAQPGSGPRIIEVTAPRGL